MSDDAQTIQYLLEMIAKAYSRGIDEGIRASQAERRVEELEQVWLPCDQTLQCAVCRWVDWGEEHEQGHPETCPIGHLQKQIEVAEARAAEQERRVNILHKECDQRVAERDAAEAREQKLQEMLGWCIEGIEGTVGAEFWESPLWKRLREALPDCKPPQHQHDHDLASGNCICGAEPLKGGGWRERT